jgi:hypothetical protein
VTRITIYDYQLRWFRVEVSLYEVHKLSALLQGNPMSVLAPGRPMVFVELRLFLLFLLPAGNGS